MSPKTATRRRLHARPRSAPLTTAQSRQAAAQGTATRKHQAAMMGRAIPASRDEDLVRLRIDTALVRKGARIIDRDPTFVAWVTDKVTSAQAGPGRPGALSVRSALICFWLLNVTSRNNHLINLPALLANLSPRVRRQLGIDYLDSAGHPRQLSYGQIRRVFSNIAEAFDPFADGLDQDQIRTRAADLQEFSLRLVRASVNNQAHAGHYAADATMVWSWDRPPGKLNGKIRRRGRDGDNGRPLSLTQIIGGEKEGDVDLARAGFVEDPFALGPPTPGPETSETSELPAGPPDPFGAPPTGSQQPKTTAKKHRRGHHRGAAWIGHSNPRKSVFGYAMHTLTVTDPAAPSVIEALAVTPANALPAPAITPLLRSLYDARAADPALTEVPGARLIGHVVADPAYSPNVEHWQLPIRSLGGSAVFRLHRTNQAGRKSIRGTTFVDGRPYCTCIPDDLANLEFPKFPYTRSELEEHQDAVELRQPFEMKPNGTYRANGSRQFLSPHFDKTTRSGGCEHCTDAHGHPVIDEETGQPRPRCCTQATRTFTSTELGLYQDTVFGSREWSDLWNPRNRVEGSYGVIKALALVNWGHGYHHFTGLARESVVATFAVMAHNFHIQRTHAARMKLLAEKNPQHNAPAAPLPSAHPTQTLPPELATAAKAAEAARREASPRGPKGLEFLGTPRRPGP